MRYFATVLILSVCFALFPARSVPAQRLTPERAAEAAVRDAKELPGADLNGSYFMGKVQYLPECLRLEILAAERPSDIPGKPFAIYEFDLKTGKIVRRDFNPPEAGISFDTASVGSASQRLYIGIHGVLRNIPGYILQTPGFLSNFSIWAEAGGKVVATETELIGSTVYHLRNIPVSAGTVVIKAKVRGYDLKILHPGVTLNPAQPVGTIGGIDIDFSALQPIYRDVRILVRSTPITADCTGSFPDGARARVFVNETGHTAEAASQNGIGEALFTNIPTGWPLNFMAINQNQGYYTGEAGPIIIPEDGGTAFTQMILLK